MKLLPPSVISTWHAHGDFDATSGDAAWAPRETIAAAQTVQNELRHFHERLEVAASSMAALRRVYLAVE